MADPVLAAAEQWCLSSSDHCWEALLGLVSAVFWYSSPHLQIWWMLCTITFCKRVILSWVISTSYQNNSRYVFSWFALSQHKYCGGILYLRKIAAVQQLVGAEKSPLFWVRVLFRACISLLPFRTQYQNAVLRLRTPCSGGLKPCLWMTVTCVQSSLTPVPVQCMSL